MERRVQNKRTQRGRKKATFSDAWGLVVFTAGAGYAATALYSLQADAEAAAKETTRRALDDAAYLPGIPYTAADAVAVEGKHPCGTPLYPLLCGAPGARSLLLFLTEEARAAARAGEDTAVGPPLTFTAPKKAGDRLA